MTAMDVTFRYAGTLDAAQLESLARVSDVYGIRKLRIDEEAHVLAIEYDATRLTDARVEALIRGCAVVSAELAPA